ncbi:hypothetical protein QVD17_06249 [Tagetes erecta]|uniref:Uncharacterized protein n=1 Tax=Tagetes erecta TaxID=13708 RepID=A0AAD8LFA4_TARER|nr:hypothetical protein QVD17_06249 [Tagetes erecta]
MFKVNPRNTSYHKQHLLVDANGIPIVTIRKKILTAHSKWKVFKGNSTAHSELIFSTKTPIIMQTTNVHVFLANKIGSKDCFDFKIKGSWSNKSCTIYLGDSETIIAQMHKMEPSENVKEKCMVKVYPNVDYAFVVTLMLIFEAMNPSDADNVDDENHNDTNADTLHVIGEVLYLGAAAGVLGMILT